MISVDTSSIVAFFHDLSGNDVDGVDGCFDTKSLILSPVVVSELLSDHKLSYEVRKLILALPTLTLKPGFWERAGLMRSRLLRRGLKARLADTLIAQSAIDYSLPLITRDSDFKSFAKYESLKLWGK